MYRGNHNSVQSDPPYLTRLLLLEFQFISRLLVADLPDSYSKQIACTQVGINPQREKTKISGVVGQHLFYQGNVFFGVGCENEELIQRLSPGVFSKLDVD